MASEKLLFYGGAFDPPHSGHRKLLEAAVEAIRPDITLVIPTGVSPHKKASRTPFRDRVHMARLAFSGTGEAVVSTMEGRGGRSYTIKTLRKLKKKYPGREIYMLIGSDMLITFRQWHLYRRILSMVTLVAGCRKDMDSGSFRDAAASLEKEGARIVILDFRPDEISSSELRRTITEGSVPEGLLDSGVEAYIKKRGLYST